MIEYPGCHYYPIAYADDEVVIRRAYEAVHAYHKCNYKTPLKGNQTMGWLCCGIWKITADGKYRKENGLGYLTGKIADTIEDIVKNIKEEN